MNPGSPWMAALRRGRCLREMLTGWLLAALLLMPGAGGGQETGPAWWAQRGVIRPGAGLDDYAVINQGQLKNLVRAAVAEMNAKLTEGAGPGLNGTVNAWNAGAPGADDYAAVNLGQLKATALPVYQRLLATGAITALPAWADAQAAGGDDFALANVGQAKALFAFSVPFQDDPNIERESLDALPVESPFVIRYHGWQSGKIRPGRGEEGAPPEITTVHTGEMRTWQWVAGETASDKPTKQQAAQTVLVDFDQLAAAESWRDTHDEPAQPYLKHTTVVEVDSADPDEPGDWDWIYVYRDSAETNEEEGSPATPERTAVLTLQLAPGAAAFNSWPARDGEAEYEMISEAAWTKAQYTSAQVAAHWFSQVAAGPVTAPVAGWEAAPEQATALVLGKLRDPGPVIPHEELKLPTAGGLVAAAHAALSSVEQTYEDAGGQTVTKARYTGERSQGYVTIAWRPDLAPMLSVAEKQAWLNRFRVTQKTTNTPAQGAASTEVETRPLSHYLEAGRTGSAYISLSPDLFNGNEQTVELHVSFLGLPLPPPVIMEALYAQQNVRLEKMALRGLVVRMTQGQYPVRNQEVTFELFESPGGLLPPENPAAEPQTTLQRVTDDSGKARVEFKASDQPAYSWIKASAAGVQPQWFLMTVAGGGAGEGGEGFPANPPGSSGVNFAYDSNGDGISDAEENTPLDTDGDGVPDDEDMVPYDALFRESRYTHSGERTKTSRGAGRYAVVDMGEGGPYHSTNYRMMGSSGAMVWGDYYFNDTFYAWSPEVPGLSLTEPVEFTYADVDAATGLEDTYIYDNSHRGHLCGLGRDADNKDRVFTYDPFTGQAQVFPLSPAYTEHYNNGYESPRWGPGDGVLVTVRYYDEENRQRYRLVLLSGGGEAVLEDQQWRDEPPMSETPESIPAVIPVGMATYHTMSASGGEGGMVHWSRVWEAQAEDVFDYDLEEGAYSYRSYSGQQETMTYRLHTPQGNTVLLGVRDALAESTMNFRNVSTHTPQPWLAGSKAEAGPPGQWADPLDHLWMPKAEGYLARRIYGSAEQYALERPLGGVLQINARGEILASGYMSDGTNDLGVWANGEGTSLAEMVGEETMDQYAYDWVLHGLSDQGTLAATVRRLSDNTYRVLLLVPVEVDNLTRNTHTGEISSLGSEIAEALPVPEIDLTITEAEIEGLSLNLSVTCKVRDTLSELPGVLPVDQLQLFINGDLVEDITNLGAMAAGSPLPVWQARSSEVEIQRNFTIPLSSGLQTVSAQTSDNAAGNHGYAAAYVMIGNHMPPEQTVATSLRPKIKLSAPLSSSTTDTITVQFPGEAQATLNETDHATSYFVGTAVIASVAQQVKIHIKSSVSLEPTTNGSFGAVVTIGSASVASYEGWWQETGVNTQEFECSEFYHSSHAPELLYVDSIKQSGLGEIGFVQPFVTRLTVSPTFKALVSEDGPLKLTLNGAEVPLVEKPAFIPDDDHPDHVYIGQDSHPRLFNAHEALEGGTLAPEGMVTQQEFKVELRQRNDDSVVWSQDQTIIRAQPSFHHMEAGSIAEETPPAIDPATLTQAEFDEQMMIYYDVLFGEYGRALHAAGVELNFGFSYGSLPWSFVKWDVDNYLQGAYNEGKRAHITLDREGLKTPAKAAQALFAALRHLFHTYCSAIQIQEKTPPEVPSALLSPEDAAIYQELSQGRYDRINEAMGDVSMAVEMGISIANPTTGVLLSVSHISDAFRDGQDASAYTQSALLLLPLAAKFAVRAGKSLTVRLGRFADDVDFVIPPTAPKELITALQTIATGDRVVAMRQLRPLIESGKVSANWIELWYKAGWLKYPVKKKGGVVIEEGVVKRGPYTKLMEGILQRQGLAKKPAGTITHHDFPFQTGGTTEGLENLQLAFLKRGLDPDDGLLSGRFLDKRFHQDVIHGGKEVFGPGGAWNYQWIRFFDEAGESANADAILEFLEDLIVKTSDYTMTSWKQVDWIYTP